MFSKCCYFYLEVGPFFPSGSCRDEIQKEMPIYNTSVTKHAPQNECRVLLNQLRALCISTLQPMMSVTPGLLCRADCLGTGAPHLSG